VRTFTIALLPEDSARSAWNPPPLCFQSPALDTGLDFRPGTILVDSTRRKSLIRWQKRAAAWEHRFECARKGPCLLQVKVLSRKLSVHPGSYRGGEEGDGIAEALGTSAHMGGSASRRAAT
jgi:hypothetical protein